MDIQKKYDAENSRYTKNRNILKKLIEDYETPVCDQDKEYNMKCSNCESTKNCVECNTLVNNFIECFKLYKINNEKLEQNNTKLNGIQKIDEDQIQFSKSLIDNVIINIKNFDDMILDSIYLPNGLLQFIINKHQQNYLEDKEPEFYIRVAYYLNFPSVTGWNEQQQIPYGFEIDLIIKLFDSIHKYLELITFEDRYDNFTEVNITSVEQLSEIEQKKPRVKRFGILEFVPISNYDNLWLFPKGTHIAIGGMSDSLIRRLTQNELIKSTSLKNFERWEKLRKLGIKGINKLGSEKTKQKVENDVHELLAALEENSGQAVTETDQNTQLKEGDIKKLGKSESSVEHLIDMSGIELIQKLKLLNQQCESNLQLLLKNDQLIKTPSWTIPYYTVKRTLIFSNKNEKMKNFQNAIKILMTNHYDTIITNMKKLIKLRKQPKLNSDEHSELEKLIEKEKIYEPYLNLLKKKAINQYETKESDEEKYIKYIQNIKLKTSSNAIEFQKLLNNTMANLPENLKIIATINSTGWIDASERLKMSKRKDIILIEGTSENDDLQKLLNGEIDGLMRGSNYAKSLTQKSKEIDFLPPWDIIQNVVPNYGTQHIPTETFEITSIENELTHFMNIGLIRLSLLGYITDLKKKFEL